jgi:hypothetical protein
MLILTFQIKFNNREVIKGNSWFTALKNLKNRVGWRLKHVRSLRGGCYELLHDRLAIRENCKLFCSVSNKPTVLGMSDVWKVKIDKSRRKGSKWVAEKILVCQEWPHTKTLSLQFANSSKIYSVFSEMKLTELSTERQKLLKHTTNMLNFLILCVTKISTTLCGKCQWPQVTRWPQDVRHWSILLCLHFYAPILLILHKWLPEFEHAHSQLSGRDGDQNLQPTEFYNGFQNHSTRIALHFVLLAPPVSNFTYSPFKI